MPKINNVIGKLVRCINNDVSPDFQLDENFNYLVIDESARNIRLFGNDAQESFWHDKSRFAPTANYNGGAHV